MLKASARGLRRFLNDGDELYRLEGANFVITGPLTNLCPALSSVSPSRTQNSVAPEPP